MRTIAIIGGSKGIGNFILKILIENHEIINISRTSPAISCDNLTHYDCDVLTNELPKLDSLDGLVCCPGGINLKPISRLSLEDFREKRLPFQDKCLKWTAEL